MRVLSGSIEETLYGSSPDLSVKRSTILCNGESSYINDAIGLHRIANKSGVVPAVSLHLYSPPIVRCNRWDAESSQMVNDMSPVDSFRGRVITERPEPSTSQP